MAAALSSSENSGISPDHLAKVWRISYDEAKRTIDNTSQLSVCPNNPILAKNYGTNDRMLRYKRIKEWFYTNTFFATKKGGSLQGDIPAVSCLLLTKGLSMLFL